MFHARYHLFYCVLLANILQIIHADEDWVQFALQTQRNLISDYLHIDKAPLVGTHNSYSSAVYFSILQNQKLSLTAQFEIGVRYIELDLHYIPELNQTEQGPYRICHASSDIYKACVADGWGNCTANGIHDYGEDTGCSNFAPNFTQIFEEISDWLFTNPDEVIVINFDDAISDADVNSTSSMGDLINDWLEIYFGNIIYTPLDLVTKNGNIWPTISRLKSYKKNLILNTNKHTWGEVFIHPDLRGFVWPESKIEYFSGFPSCTSTTRTANGTVQFGFFQEDRLVIVYGGEVLYNGSVEVGTFTNSSALGVMECVYSTFYDFFTADSAENLVWSWDYGQPINESCASYNTKTGRWVAERCDEVSRFFACRSTSNSSEWTISSKSSTRDNYESSVCPKGFSFTSPRTAKENYELLMTSENLYENIWISMTRYPNGTWSDIPTIKDKSHVALYIGIALGSILAVIVLVALLYYLFVIRRSRTQPPSPPDSDFVMLKSGRNNEDEDD